MSYKCAVSDQATEEVFNDERPDLGLPDNHWRLNEKWGSVIGGTPQTGFVAIPTALLAGQAELGIKPTEMVVLQHILMHWWHPSINPFPSNKTIAKRMGVDSRTVQRAMRTLQQQGLIKRDVNRHFNEESRVFRSVRRIDLSGLVKQLQPIAERLSLWDKQREERKNEWNGDDNDLPF